MAIVAIPTVWQDRQYRQPPFVSYKMCVKLAIKIMAFIIAKQDHVEYIHRFQELHL